MSLVGTEWCNFPCVVAVVVAAAAAAVVVVVVAVVVVVVVVVDICRDQRGAGRRRTWVDQALLSQLPIDADDAGLSLCDCQTLSILAGGEGVEAAGAEERRRRVHRGRLKGAT